MPAATTTKAKTITEALIAFQAELPKPVLDKTNPAFKSKYLSLGALTDAAFPVLGKHGLAYTTTTEVREGSLVLKATLLHETGELVAEFPITETLPQKVGSAVTYYRRYGLASLTGIVADEDDDGNAASAGPSSAQKAADKARGTTAQPGPATTAAASTQNAVKKQIQALIDDPAKPQVTREAANSLSESHKANGLNGDALWAAVLKDLDK